MQFSHTIQLFETNKELIEDFTDSVFSIDGNLRINYWNRGSETIFGYSKKEALGMSIDDILSNDSAKSQMRDVISKLMIDREWRGDIIYKTKSNELIYCMNSIVTIQQGTSINNFLFVVKDITNQKELKKVINTFTADLTLKNIKEITTTNSIERRNDGFFSFDRNWCYLHINKKAADLLKRDPLDLIGKNVWIEFPELVNSVFYKIYHEVLEARQYKKVKSFSPLLGKWLEVDIYPSNEILSVFLKEITENKTSESLIRDREEKYHSIFKNAQDGILMIDESQKITFVNFCLSNMLGYKPEEIIGKKLHKFIHEDFLTEVSESIDKKRYSWTINLDIKLQNNINVFFWVSLQITPILNQGQYSGSLILVNNIETNREKELELKKSNLQLRQLAVKLQSIREEERSAIAREIHDDLAQQLTALKMDVYWLSKNIPADERIKQKTESMLSIVTETLSRLKQKAIDLHPGLLKDLGLIAGINWQNNQFKSRHEISIDFSVIGNDDLMPVDIALAFYRIYQESLSNISKHAQATCIKSSFVCNEKGYYLAISDNGVGFDLQHVNKKPSLGILSIKERSIAIGGTCFIDSEIGRGTLVSVFVEL